MKRQKLIFVTFLLLIIIWTLPYSTKATDDYRDLVISNLDETRSRLLMVDGNMYFHAGKSKNITFRVSDGARILFGKTDILALPNSTQISELNELINRHTRNVDAWNSMFSSLETQVYDSKTEATHIANEIKLIKENITSLMKSRKGTGRANAKLKRLLTMVHDNILKVVKMIQTDECLQQPCENGGTCIDLASKFFCLCPSHFEGKNCQLRIDECELYGKTELGCQNNATCENNGNLAGYTCHCQSGFHGRLCQTKSNSCDQSFDLCGDHGHCIPKGKDAYKCLCDVGYKSDEDPTNPACIDVDECAQSPCYPGAGCLNFPGGFRCTSCPAGYQGNGIHCVDFDECKDSMTNECSKDPKVECINTYGNYTCGSCPPGWEGDGRVCTKVQETCDDEPCSPQATCTMNPDVECSCSDGFEGDGKGPNGCTKILTDEEQRCDEQGCRNGGTCVTPEYGTIGTSFCRCTYGFIGPHCEKYDVCAGNPCGDNGKCVEFRGLRKCECNPGYYGVICQNQEDTCGFHTHNETGTIEYNRSTRFVELRDTNCQWIIQLFDTRKILEFRFENFSIPKLYSLTSKGCRFGFANLTIHDGPSADQPLIGGFCHGDNTVPDMNVPFYTSGNAAKLMFFIRLHSGATYIKISWKAKEPRCGGRITQSSGTISYFDVHDDDICAWYISVPPQYHIELTLKSAKMASDAAVNCSVNSLELFDHQTASNRTRLTEICESQSKALVFRTTVPYATVYFKTNRKLTDLSTPIIDCLKDSKNPWCGVGFVLSYRTIELPNGCGGEITPDANGKMEGYIESPGYGHNYFPNLSCQWILNATVENASLASAESARKVQIEFMDFDVATSETKYISSLSRISERVLQNCIGDYLRIVPRGGMFCNMLPPKGVYSSSYFDIKFVTDSTVSGRGFKLKYKSVCEMDFTAKNGTISSPNYPASSNVAFQCTYRILASPHQAIRVTFRYIGLKADINTCFYNAEKQKESSDYIELQGGHKSNEQINRKYVCARYPFVAPHGEVVASGIVPFSITYSSSGDSEQLYSNTGFSFDYEIFDVGCGGLFHQSTGTITSPNYPERYHPHMYCIYEIIVSYQQKVRLTFDNFDVENVANQDECGFDNVQVYDGIYVNEDEHGELLGRFCGMGKPPSLLSKSNKMSVVFLSDRSVNGAGFSANYRAVNAADDCDQTFTNLEGYIEYNSTQHPRVTKCNYVVMLPKMHRIMLTFENFTLPCTQGSLIPRNGMSLDAPAFPGITDLCGSKTLPQLITQGNRAFFQFTTNSPDSTHFRIKYEQFSAGCGGKVTGIRGFISAPQYPLKDSRSLNCDWTVSVGEGNRVKISFHFIDNLDSADGSGECNAFGANYIDVSDGPYADDNLLQRYCTQEVSTSAIISEGNQVSVKYVQHGGSYHGALFGFLAHFDTVCKDIILTEHHGSIQSPGFPGPIDEGTRLNCKWTIRTTPGSRINVRFHSFDVKSKLMGSICNNHLMIPSAQVDNITANGVAPTYQDTKFCEYYVPQEIISKNNTLTLEYNLMGARPDNKFWLSWTTIGCGGIILKNNSEMVVTKNHFTNNEIERECQWVIKAPLGFVVKVSIEFGKFVGAVEQSKPCDDPSKTTQTGDGIQFYAGTDNSSGVPQKIFCGLVSNQTFISHTNEVFAFMRLASNNHMADQFNVTFKAKVEFVKIDMKYDVSCGGIIELDDNKPSFIQSPNYPKLYPAGISCIWEIHAPNGSQVALNLTEFNHPSGKKQHYYRVFDGIADVNCTASTAYMEGSLAFYDGTYDPSDTFSLRNKLLHRVCLQTEKPRHILTKAQKVVIVFHGSPQTVTTKSNEDTNKKKIGFNLKVWAQCGGTLIAKQESQSFIIANANDDNPMSLRYYCTYKFIKSEDDEDEGDTLYIQSRRLPYSDVSARANALDTFTFGCNEDEPDSHYIDFKQDLAIEKDFSNCEGNVQLETHVTKISGKYLISYGLESQFCGGVVDQYLRHIRYKINKKKSSDCEWEFVAPNGFLVALDIDFVRLPESELCQESFIEIKKSSSNVSEPRICNEGPKNQRYSSQKITVRLRYHVNEDHDEDELNNIMGDFTMQLKSKIVVDTFPESSFIESPPATAFPRSNTFWFLQAKQNKTKLKITFERLNLSPYSPTVLSLAPTQCFSEEECSAASVEGYIEEGMTPKIYYFNSKEVKVDFRQADSYSSFRLKWEEVDESEYREIVGDNNKPSSETLATYNCGGELYPTYETQTLENPKGLFGNYENDKKCKWTINRQRFTNVILKITYLDLEEQTSCQYDYIGIGILDLSLTELLLNPVGMLTYCKSDTATVGISSELEYHQNVFIYFVTDRSRTASGFKIEYKLGCRSFDYISDVGAPLLAEITSPNWPSNYGKNESCFWGVILGSSRQLKVTAEIDIDGTDGSCVGDWLITEEVPSAYGGPSTIGGLSGKRCGQISYQKTFNGRLYAYFNSDNTVEKKGFKLTLEEVVIDCSSTSLWVDERNPVRVLSSPEFPHLYPNSLNCHWIIHTTPGHRVKFTVDPHTFNLQNSDENECIDDYIEIRDGPSESSPLIGKYCEDDAPSTIFSTDSSLFVRFITDSWTKSLGFNATYEVASCGGSVVLQQGVKTGITSPNYPDPYPELTNCSWNIVAPKGHFVEAKVEQIWLNYSQNCTLEYLLLKDKNATGEELMPRTCSKFQTNADGYQSMHNSMYVEFHSNSTGNKMTRMSCSDRKCGFDLKISSSSFECGGEINDDQGTITLPGYPERIIPHLSCEWEFKAGMGNRYSLSFSFLNEENGFYLDSFADHCYPDIEIFNGPPFVRDSLLATEKRFCQNRTTFISMSDLATITYQDQINYALSGPTRHRTVFEERLSKPWKISYQKITNQFNYEGCSSIISQDMSMKIGNLTLQRGSNYGLGARSFCHLQVKRPTGNLGTTVTKFSAMKPRNSIFKNCAQGNRVILIEKEIGPWEINEVVCNVSAKVNETVFIFPNAIFDIYVVNNPHRLFVDNPLEFRLQVKFYPCGATILEDEVEDQTGLIFSPNFDKQLNYNNNDNCLWYIQASEGKIVEVVIEYMDIEHHVDGCKNDHLIIAEGEGIHSVIHRLCHDLEEPLPDRNKIIRSRGRDLTLLWQTDNTMQRKGFNLTWSFVHYHTDSENGCGFSSHAMNGMIETPHYPKDYPNNVQCIWNIVVPVGYHIKLTFEKFDLQLSTSCEKDYLQISQEHNSRALAPLEDYYFYFDNDEKHQAICGSTLPAPFLSETNRIRLNFTSDDSVAGKGFKVLWKAECGGTLTLTHGVVTSPHYPDYYPNEDFECKYAIIPAVPNNGVPIVVFKLLDFDMATPSFPWRSANAEFYGKFECVKDFLEIIDIEKNRIIAKYCQENMQSTTSAPAISIRGGIGVRFVGNQSYFEGQEMKRHRGFKISYALADCGGEINLADTRERVSATLTSPGFPLPYHNNLDCVWNITAPEDRVISAKFTNVDMELNYNSCIFDFIELYDGIQTNFSTTINDTNGLMGRYCGEDAPTDYLITTTPNMTIKFHSDHSSTKSGFKLVLTATLGPKGGCGGNLTATEKWQTLTPPMKDEKYANGLRCLWKMKTKEPKNLIELKFMKMEVEKRKRGDNVASGCYDFVAIYDGPRGSSSFLLQPTCDFPELPATFQSSYRMADFYFETDSADGFEGFSVDYRQVKDDCGATLQASRESSEFTYESERGLTRENQHHKRCRFFIYAKEGQPIEIEFLQFNFPSTDSTCPLEFLEIRDVGNFAECTHPACSTKPKTPTNHRYCRKNMPTRFVSQTSVVQITSSVLLQSEYASSFRFNYKLIDQCNRTVTFEAGSHFASGRLTSPNYPNSYDDNTTCITSIAAPLDYQILVVFKEFRVERGEGFRHRFPGIGGNYGSPYWRRGGYSRISSSPYSFSRYYYSNACSYDSLIVNLNPSNSTTGVPFCGFTLPPSLFSTLNKLDLTFKTDDSMTHGGYELSYYAAKQVTTTSNSRKAIYEFEPSFEKTGALTPIGFPANYPNNTIQRFSIRPPPGLFCTFKMMTFQMTSSADVDNCEATDMLKYKTVIATNDGQEDEYKTTNLITPCISGEEIFEFPKSKGLNYYFEFTSDNDNDNNGSGFRIHWDCEDYTEEII